METTNPGTKTGNATCPQRYITAGPMALLVVIITPVLTVRTKNMDTERMPQRSIEWVEALKDWNDS
eukprot:14014324-Ditylum_brightwellii.AAC.1